MMVSRNKSSFRRLVLTAALLSISALMVLGGLDEIARADDAVPVLTRGDGRFVLLSDGRVVGFDSPDFWSGERYLEGMRGVTDIAVGGSQFMFKNKDPNYGEGRRIGQLSALTSSGALLITDANCGGGDDGTVDCTYLPAREVPLKVKAKQIAGSNFWLGYIGENGRLYLHYWRSVSEDRNAGDFQKLLKDESKLNFSMVEIDAKFIEISVFGDMISAIDDKNNIYILGNKEKLYEEFGQLPNKLSLNDTSYVKFQASMPVEGIYLGKILYVRDRNGNLYSLGRLNYRHEEFLSSISKKDYDLKYKNSIYGQISLIDKDVKTVFALPSSTLIVHHNLQITYIYQAIGDFLMGDGEGKPISQETFRPVWDFTATNMVDDYKFYNSNFQYQPKPFLSGVDITSVDQAGYRIVLITGNQLYISGWDDLRGPHTPQVRSDCAKDTYLKNTVEIDIPNCLKR